MKEIEVYFVRHGETMYNLMRKMQGWSDTPLTDRGIPVLEETANRLRDIHFDAVYSSDLKRAVDTAKIVLTPNIATNSGISESKYFREVFFGSFEGTNEEKTWEIVGKPYGIKTIQEFRQNYTSDFLRDATKAADNLHLAEDAAEVQDRMHKGFEQLLAENADHSRILVTTHGGFINDLVPMDSTVSPDFEYPFPKNGSITKSRITEKSVMIDDFAV